MSDTANAAPQAELPPPAPDAKIEKPRENIKAVIDSEDVSGVFRRAQAYVDQVVAAELAISQINNPSAIVIAAPEVAKLSEKDLELKKMTEATLKKLEKSLGSVRDPEEPVLKPLQLKSITQEKLETSEELLRQIGSEFEKTVNPVEAAQDVEVDVSEMEEEGTVHLNPEKLARLVTVAEELTNEETALHDFEKSHSHAVTGLEEAYLSALKTRVDALSFERKSIESGREDQQTITDHRMKADEAEAVYQKMYEKHLEETVAAKTVKTEEYPLEPMSSEKLVQSDVKNKTSELENFEFDYSEHDSERYGSYGQNHFQSNSEQPTASRSSERNAMNLPSEQSKPPGKIGQAVGKFVDGLKFWKYFTRK